MPHETASPVSSSHQNELASALREIFAFMREHSTQKSSEATEYTLEAGTENVCPSLEGDEEIAHPEVSVQADEQTVLQNQGTEPGMFLR